MGNANRGNANEVGSRDNSYASSDESMRVILLAQAACKQAYRMMSELKLAGIAARTESLSVEAGKRLADGLGIRFVVAVDDRNGTNVQLADLHEHQEGSMPMDQAIYVIEKVYPPADFT
ncbi:hypothetical protein ACFPES_12925 [Paenibacillus sp. GCM10023248]|uniref:hypothetical protein n=1 Tax=Bacillales TaxID=1385 RepID=UPI0023792322|nr:MULTISPECIES: hypothetical protein [Bacillales]MDD9267933.1 hypothetical protein [Paenibacillus sp. MAHUQ-63]MDR6882365.1 histidyl-tRNA synthetase [Bacillus sp. 3255]